MQGEHPTRTALIATTASLMDRHPLDEIRKDEIFEGIEGVTELTQSPENLPRRFYRTDLDPVSVALFIQADSFGEPLRHNPQHE